MRCPISTYEQWCARLQVDHAHCPRSCEHPQPIVGDDGNLYCGRCWFKYGDVVEMVPCSADVCGAERDNE